MWKPHVCALPEANIGPGWSQGWAGGRYRERVDRKYQVFVSSTYQDLVEERREVMQALLEMDCLPAGMEMFPAANEDQWTLIKEVIDECDYYIVIVGGRYGSTTAEGISYTEMEYDYAVANKIPVMGFVHANPDDIPKGKSEMDPEAAARLDAFRAKVMDRMVKQYASPAELGSVVSRGLVRLTKRNPQPGWVRGDQAMTPETRAEMAELRATVATLQQAQVERQIERGADQLNTEFQHGSDVIDLPVWASMSRFSSDPTHTGSIELTWDEIVSQIGPAMIDEASEKTIRSALDAAAFQAFSDRDEKPYGRGGVTDEAWGTVIVQLRALGIIAVSSRKRGVNDKSIYWRLTPAGDAYLVNLRALRRDEGDPERPTDT